MARRQAIAYLLMCGEAAAPCAYWLAPEGASLAAVAGAGDAAGADAIGADAAVSLAGAVLPAVSEPRLQPAVSDIAATTAASTAIRVM